MKNIADRLRKERYSEKFTGYTDPKTQFIFVSLAPAACAGRGSVRNLSAVRHRGRISARIQTCVGRLRWSRFSPQSFGGEAPRPNFRTNSNLRWPLALVAVQSVIFGRVITVPSAILPERSLSGLSRRISDQRVLSPNSFSAITKRLSFALAR